MLYDKADSGQIFFKFLEPKFNTEKKHWETEIVICQGDGTIESFGYTPTATVPIRQGVSATPTGQKKEKQETKNQKPETDKETSDYYQKQIDELKAQLKEQQKTSKENQLKENLLQLNILRIAKKNSKKH